MKRLSLAWLVAALWFSVSGANLPAMIPLGPNGKKTPSYVSNRAKWAGKRNNFWLRRLPPDVDELRTKLAEVNDAPSDEQRAAAVAKFMSDPPAYWLERELIRFVQSRPEFAFPPSPTELASTYVWLPRFTPEEQPRYPIGVIPAVTGLAVAGRCVLAWVITEWSKRSS